MARRVCAIDGGRVSPELARNGSAVYVDVAGAVEPWTRAGRLTVRG